MTRLEATPEIVSERLRNVLATELQGTLTAQQARDAITSSRISAACCCRVGGKIASFEKAFEHAYSEKLERRAERKKVRP